MVYMEDSIRMHIKEVGWEGVNCIYLFHGGLLQTR